MSTQSMSISSTDFRAGGNWRLVSRSASDGGALDVDLVEQRFAGIGVKAKWQTFNIPDWI
jgi:hypothetical protein